MSKIAVVDINDKVVSEAERDLVTEKKWIRRIVRVIVYRENGDVLLQLRSANKNIFPLTYDQTVGGHVNEDEDYIDAAVRETKEEIGLVIPPKKFKEIAHFYCEETYENIFIREYNILYKYLYKGGNLNKSDLEVKSLDWISPAKIDELFENNVEKLSGGFRYAWLYYKGLVSRVH